MHETSEFMIITAYFMLAVEAIDIIAAKETFEADFPDEEILELYPLD